MKFISETAGERVDVYLVKQQPSFSRGYFQKLINAGQVKVNGESVVSHYRMKQGDTVEVFFVSEPSELIAEKRELSIVHEDDDIIVINKPAGLVVHPACGHPRGTLLNALAGHASGAFTPLLVHRLDKDTSGVLIVAKNERAKNSLVKQFQHRVVKKVYLAVVTGCVSEERGSIEAPLGRSPNDRKKMVVGPLAKKTAFTEFVVLQRTQQLSLLEVHPVTGRTHQIRSHLSYIKHPVAGDVTYGGPEQIGEHQFKRHMLHAYRISFTHPSTSRTVKFMAPPPPDILHFFKDKIKE